MVEQCKNTPGAAVGASGECLVEGCNAVQGEACLRPAREVMDRLVRPRMDKLARGDISPVTPPLKKET